jgi:hypothetical protein
MAYDGAIGKVVLFGGVVAVGGGYRRFDDTWTYDGTTWAKQSPAVHPSARQEPAMAYDPKIAKVVLFGGTVPGRYYGDFVTDTWTYDGATWTQQHPASSPPLRGTAGLNTGNPMAYDPAIGKLVLYVDEETWTYNGETWTKESPAASPSGSGPVTYDATLRHPLVLSMGYGYDGTTWAYNGKTWIRQAGPPSPPQDTLGCSMAYDATIGRTVRFGGVPPEDRSGRGPHNETWTYDGTTWTKQFPATAPTRRSGASMVYDPRLNSLVLYGGVGYDLTHRYGSLGDTWTYGITHAR